MSDLLEILAKNKQKILLAEIAALLHDLGKLNSSFFKKHLDKTKQTKYDHDKILEYDNRKSLFTFLNEKLDPEGTTGEDMLLVHQGYINGKQENFDKHSTLGKMIILADKLSSTEDRNWPKEVQEGNYIFKATPFGAEDNIKLDELDKQRGLLYISFDKADQRWKASIDKDKEIEELRNQIFEKVYTAFSEGQSIADTERPANDINLWDHAYSTATFLKALWAQFILGIPLNTTSAKKVDHIRLKKDFKDHFVIMTVQFALKQEFAKVEKIADLKGRLEVLEKTQQILKKKFEVEFAAGNEIYNEPGISCFLLPVQFIADKGKTEIEEVVQKILEQESFIIPYKVDFKEIQWSTESIYKYLPKLLKEIRDRVLPVNSWYVNHIKSQRYWEEAAAGAEVCPICGLLPSEKENNGWFGKGLCNDCKNLRLAGQDKRRTNNEETIWINEIADIETRRIAILSIEVPLEQWFDENGMLLMYQYKDKNGNDTFKTLSYERIRRFWAATEEYLQEVEKRVREELGINERLRLDLELINQSQKMEQGQFYLVQGPEQSEVYLSRSNDDQLKFQTVTRLRHPENWQKGGEICLQDDRLRGLKFQTRIKDIHTEKYYPLTKVFQSKNHLILIVPAKKARNLALAAMDLFERRFSKALGKLPLSIGMIYAPVKLPLSLSLQAMFKMQKYLRQQANQLQTAEVIKKEENGKMAVKLNLKAEGVPEAEIGLTIDTVLGDNDSGKFEKQDVFYTRLPVICDKSKPGERNILQKVSLWDTNECMPVLAHELNHGDRLRILLGTFDFEFLESAARRFDLHLNKDKTEAKRTTHRILGSQGPRPFNIFHLKLMADLEELLKKQPNITDTHLKNIYQLLAAKAAEWDFDKAPKDSEIRLTYENLVKAVLAKEFEFSAPEGEFFKQAVLSGLFFDWMELFYQIEKRKLREG